LTDKRKKFLSIPLDAGNEIVGSCVGGAATDGAGLYRAWSAKWSAKFGITSARTRNGQLCGPVGEMFHQVGHEMALRIATEQFRSKTVETVATLPKHLESFNGLWRGLQLGWLAGLTQAVAS
jgi:hypothetical protein